MLGTPVYMPPEQAAGKIDAIDQRSDIYSLGAILYEMLTLQRPWTRKAATWPSSCGWWKERSSRRSSGSRQRAKAGKIPNELSAIAMKALAKEKEQRYPNVEALRRDIERFQEGRSVSAKEDTQMGDALEAGQAEQGV